MGKKSEQLCEKCKHFLDGKCRKGIPHLLGQVISCGTFEVMTNGDAIRAMTDEELAEKISRMVHCVYCPIKCGICCTEEECKAKWLPWLRSPVEESEK